MKCQDSGVPKVLQVWRVPWAPCEEGATEQFPLKSDEPSSNSEKIIFLRCISLTHLD